MNFFRNLFSGRWSRLSSNMSNDSIRGLNFYPIASTTEYNNMYTEQAKLKVLLENPALLTVFSINSDLFSLGKVKIVNDNGGVIENHPLHQVLRQPNFFQTENQFMFDFMFWTMFGNSYCFIDSKVDLENNDLYFLNNSKMDFSEYMVENGDKLMLSKSSYNRFVNEMVEYHYEDGNSKMIRFSKILHTTDMTSSATTWYKGASKVDALYKVISNSELSLDAKNIELLFSKKYMVAGQVSEDDLTQPMMMPGDKSDIEQKAMQDRPVTAVRSMIDIKRFVEDLKTEGFDKGFIQDVFTIARLYNIPKDVIEVNLDAGAKYENKKHASADHIDYSLKPKGDDFVNGLLRYFGMEGRSDMSWDHLPFMRVREEQKYEAKKKQATAYKLLIDAGVEPDDARRECGYEF